MRLDRQFRTDPAAEIDGVWIPIGQGAALKIARAGNPKHRAVLDELRQPLRALVLAGVEPPTEEIDRIAIAAMARTILLDWRGIEDEDGNALPYAQEAAEAALTRLPDFRDLISALAMDAAAFRMQGLEAARKNCSGPSTGISGGGPTSIF